MIVPKSIEKLIEHFNKLPGIGPKTSQRLVFYLIKFQRKNLPEFAKAITDVNQQIKTCSQCSNLTETDPCPICSDAKRDKTTICVVEDVPELLSIEALNEFNGLYHVLGGKIKPLEGISPKDLNLQSLITRIKDNQVKEIILALNPDLEGESTMIYLSKLLIQYVPTITRLAQGLPLGSELTYADDFTLTSALKSRRQIDIK